MKKRKGTGRWVSAKEITISRSTLNNRLAKFAVLASVWDKETGSVGDMWKLVSVKAGTIFVEVSNSTARQELDIRKSSLIRELNKHFARNWIKEIKVIFKY